MALTFPTLLPPFDSVEVVDLNSATGSEISARMSGETPARRARVEGNTAQRIGELFRGLPSGEQARCHRPPFGLMFHLGDEVVAKASICWKCNNVRGHAGEEPLFFQFDGAAKVSRELLAACKTAIAAAG